MKIDYRGETIEIKFAEIDEAFGEFSSLTGIKIAKKQSPTQECMTLVHEVGHLVAARLYETEIEGQGIVFPEGTACRLIEESVWVLLHNGILEYKGIGK